MKDLKWSSGEPSYDGKHIRLNTEVYRLEATPGTTGRSFICQRGQLWLNIMMGIVLLCIILKLNADYFIITVNAYYPIC